MLISEDKRKEAKKRWFAKLKADPARYADYLAKDRAYKDANKEKIKNNWKRYNKTRARTWDRSEKGKLLKLISKDYLRMGDFALSNRILQLFGKETLDEEKTKIELRKLEKCFMEYITRRKSKQRRCNKS